MSSFGFDSLIPETYKTKAEAFAKCLQHKLLSLGGLHPSTSSSYDNSRQRLNGGDERDEEERGTAHMNSFDSVEDYSKTFNQNSDDERQNGENSNRAEVPQMTGESSQKKEKTEDSDEELNSHSESENGGCRINLSAPTKRKLMSNSSEDSTVDSWSSCQDMFTDLEKADSEGESELNHFASQIKGSPKLRSFNVRSKLKEIREKPWKRNSKKNPSSSSSAESVSTIEGNRRGVKSNSKTRADNFDLDSSQYILLDGLEPEDDDEIPCRILRESSSTSSLEKHFSRTSRSECSQQEEKASVTSDADLLTPPPSPDLQRKSQQEQTGLWVGDHPVDSSTSTAEELLNRLNFAEIVTTCEDLDFDDIEFLQDFDTTSESWSVKKIGDRIVECRNDDNHPQTEVDVPSDFEWISESPHLIVSTVQVLEDKIQEQEPKHQEPDKETTELAEPTEKTPTIVEPPQDPDKTPPNPEDDELMSSRSRLRRCSSLKTWKTPPGTPGSKKIVRFADALGLDLADVRTFLDEIPKVPSSAYEDLHFDVPPNVEPLPPPQPLPTLIPLFQQPAHKMDFLEKVQRQKICLETALITDTTVLTITGYVRVQNMSFHKSVHVRYSLNNWETFSDLQATYVPHSCDGFSDKFSFVLYGHTLKIGEKLEFALRLECSGAQYWDNNGGINYVFNCLPQTSANSFFSPIYTGQTHPWLDYY